MSDVNKKYISLREASKFCPYSQEYLNLRIRQGKLKGYKEGRNWVTKKEWLDEYLKKYSKKNSQLKRSSEKQWLYLISPKIKKPRFILSAVFVLVILSFTGGLIFARQDIPSRVGAQLNNSFSQISETAEALQDKTFSLSSRIVSGAQEILKQVQDDIGDKMKQTQGIIITSLNDISLLSERSRWLIKESLQQTQTTLEQAQGVISQTFSRVYGQTLQLARLASQAKRASLAQGIIFKIQGIATKPFASIANWFNKVQETFTPRPVIVREIIQQQEAVRQEAVRPPEAVGLPSQPPPQIIQPKQIIEITKETRVVETVKETIREITRAADLIPIENMLNSLSSRLSSVIDTSGYVSSPRQYQQEGDLYLTTAGSGNVYVSASQGTYISGQQLILDATASGNKGIATILLRDPTTIQGTLSAQNGIDIIGANLTVGGTKFTVSPDTGNITSTGLLSLTQTTGTSTISHNFQVQGLLRVGSGTTYITADYIQTPYFTSGSTSTAVTGDFSVSSNATTTGNQIIQGTLTVNATSTLATTSLAYLTATSNATSTFAGGLTIDTDTLVIDYQTNRVGIGTSSPYAKLSVVGQTVSDFFTATSTTATSTFPYLSVSNNSNLGTIIGGTWQGSTITANYGGTGLTSATAGYALIGSSSTALEATSTLFVSTGGNVGIGTTSPLYKLTIQGGTGENLLQIATSTAPNVLVITSSGNVGIATSSPSQLLSIQGNGYFTGGLGVGGVESTAGNITGTGRLSITSTSATSTISTGGFTVGSSQFVVQGATGNVGIGTTTPGYKLTVNSATATENLFQVATTTNQGIFTINSAGNVSLNGNISLYRDDGKTGQLLVRGDSVAAGTGVGGLISSRSGGVNWDLVAISENGCSAAVCLGGVTAANTGILGSAQNYPLAIVTNNVERMRITNDGYVGIATTTPSSLLTVGATSGSQILINSSGQITGGTWQGTAIGATYGGTGQTTYAIYDLLYASAANTLSKVSSYNVNPTNLLPSGAGGMELWPNGTSTAPFGMTTFGAGVTVAREGTIIKHGSYSAAVTRAGTDGGLRYLDNNAAGGSGYYSQRTFTCSGWVYATVANRARIMMGESGVSSYSSYHTGDSTWQFLVATRTLGAATSAFNCGLYIDTGNTTAYVDGLTVTEGPIPPAFAEAPMTIDQTRYVVLPRTTRDMTAASGDVSYTGAGFRPRAARIEALINGSNIVSWGFVAEPVTRAISTSRAYDLNFWSDELNLVLLWSAAGAQQEADLKSYDSDGITLTWTKTGSPTGTAYLHIYLYR